MSVIPNRELPKEILDIAVTLRNCSRNIFIELFLAGRPCTAIEVAKIVGHARAYVNMRLNQLQDQGYVKSIQDGKKKRFIVSVGAKPQ